MAKKLSYRTVNNPKALHTYLEGVLNSLLEIEDVVDEIATDHATYKTSVDGIETLIEELHDDHATFKTAVDASNTWCTEVDGDLDAINNQIDFLGEGEQVVGGNFTITAGAAVTLTGAGFVTWAVDGDYYYSDLDTTITLADGGDIAAGNWGAWRILIARDGTVTTQDTGATPMAYANEEDALLNLAAIAPTAGTTTVGYFTIHSNGGFNIGTDNVNGETAANVYHVRGHHKKVSGLTAALGAALTADAAAATWSSGTIDFKRNGLRLAQIGAIANQAMDDADTVANGNAGGWLFVTNLAGTGVYALAADGAAGAVSAMTYADAAAAQTALDTLTDQLPEVFCPIGQIIVENASGGAFTAGATNWDAAGITTTETDCTVGTWDRTAKTGVDSHQISPPAVPASVTATIPAAGPATLTAAKPSSAPATLSDSDVDLDVEE